MGSSFVFGKPRACGHRSLSYKLVPWLRWDEWNFVRESLFSSSPDAVASAITRVSTWRSRGCLPVEIDVTAALIGAQQMDPFFRVALISNPPLPDDMLASLYSMGILRFVNGVIEKTRNRHDVSIAEAARIIGIPREVIDVRHEASHRALPSLQLARIVSKQALEWLKSHYWESQRNAILLQRNEAAKIRKEIECRLRELSLCLKSRQGSHSSPSLFKGKGMKRGEWLSGSNKFLSLVTSKLQSSKSGGSKKSRQRALKNIVRLYSSFPSEIVSVLFEFLNNAMNSSVLLDRPNADSLQTSIDDSKVLIGKISKQEPKLLLNLMSVVLDNVVQTLEGGQHLTSVASTAKGRNIEQLSSFTVWCAEKLKGLKLPHCEATLIGLLHKCLLVSAHSRDQLMGSALTLAQIIGNNSLFEKLKNFSLLRQSSESADGNLSHENCGSFLKRQEDSILQAAENLEFIKCRNIKGKADDPTSDDVRKQRRWVVAKHWYPCPIGMVPGAHGGSVLPVFGCDDGPKGATESSDRKEQFESIHCRGKRAASSDIEILDTISTKKMKETIEDCAIHGENELHLNGKDCLVDSEDVPVPLEGVKGRLLMGGVLKEVGEGELLTIKSAVRIFV